MKGKEKTKIYLLGMFMKDMRKGKGMSKMKVRKI